MNAMVYLGCSQLGREGRAHDRALDEEVKAALWARCVTNLPESCEEGIRAHLRKICAALQACDGLT